MAIMLPAKLFNSHTITSLKSNFKDGNIVLQSFFLFYGWLKTNTLSIFAGNDLFYGRVISLRTV